MIPQKWREIFVCVWSFQLRYINFKNGIALTCFEFVKIYVEIILEFWTINSRYFFKFLGLLRGAVKVSVLPGYGPASLGEKCPTFWDSWIVASSRVEMWVECEDETITKSRNVGQRLSRVAEELMYFSPLEDETATLSQSIGNQSPRCRPTSEIITKTTALFPSDFPQHSDPCRTKLRTMFA